MASFGSLFTGCGGLDLGLAAAGLTPAWACEQDDACVRTLARHHPGLRVDRDVRTLTGVPPVEVIAGGFPCQDLSYAGKGAGLDGDRSGLWHQMIRVVRDVRPRLVLVENVPGLLTRGLHVVLHDLATAGYAGRWLALSAAELGAPHRRERIFVLARRLEDGDRGARFAGGHPAGTYDLAGWLPSQESLLEPRPLARLGKRGRWTLDAVYEDDARLALDDDADDALLPTPGSDESAPSAEFVEAMADADVQPDRRLYLPGRRHHSQRTLSRVAPLLPTPMAEDGERGPDYAAADRSTTGDSLTTAAAKLLPGRRPSGAKASLTLSTAAALRGEISDQPFAAGDDGQLRLLPTPRVASARTSRHAMVEIDQWSAPSLEQAVELSQGDLPREFDSWDEVPGWHGRTDLDAAGGAWGVYGPAVRRWEPIIGRPAPPPVDDRGRLDPDFVEWMLGYPPGYTAGESRTARLRMLGNSVQVQVGERAGRLLLDLGRAA